MMKKQVVVTGAAGFIGGHLLERLINDGFDCTGIDDMSAGHPELLPQHVQDRIIKYDFAHEEFLKIVSDADVIYHLAAIPRVSYSVEEPHKTFITNVQKTEALLNAILKSKARLVFASSSSVYGNTTNLPTPESDVGLFKQMSPYAMQKLMCEMLIKMYSSLYNLDAVSLRFFNVFGPRQLGSSAYAQAIAAWLTAIHEKTSLRSDGDGTQLRDMCFVSNVVDALVLAGEFNQKFSGETFNVGTGNKISNNQILEILKNRYGDLNITHAPVRAGDVAATHADISNIESVLNYKPQISTTQGIDLTATWYDSHYKAKEL